MTPRTAVFFFQAEDGIRDADVTGVQTCALPISSPERLRRLLGLVVVAVHELRPAQDELPRLADRHLAVAGVEIDDLRLDVGERDADAPDLLLALTEQRVAMRHRRCLGEAVALDQLRAGH